MQYHDHDSIEIEIIFIQGRPPSQIILIKLYGIAYIHVSKLIYNCVPDVLNNARTISISFAVLLTVHDCFRYKIQYFIIDINYKEDGVYWFTKQVHQQALCLQWAVARRERPFPKGKLFGLNLFASVKKQEMMVRMNEAESLDQTVKVEWQRLEIIDIPQKTILRLAPNTESLRLGAGRDSHG